MNAQYVGSMTSSESAILRSNSGAPPLLTGVEVRGSVVGLLFEVNVEQRYLNASADNIEAVYTFPLPWGAVLLGMELVLGDKTLRGEVAAKADSEVRYEAAIEQGDTALMLERAAGGLYTVNIGNLLANETAIVRFRYAVLLAFEQGRVRMAIPMVVAPRFGSPTMAQLRAHQVPVSAALADYPCEVSILLDGAIQHGRLSSPSHSLAVRQREGRMEVSLARTARLDRDFVLLIDDLEGSSLAVVGDDGEGQVALVSFCPRIAEPLYPVPVAIKILVDCSSSMNGDSIHSARRALHEIFQQLIPADRFSYSRFGNQVVHHAAQLLPASSRALREAAGWIAGTAADLGGTEMAKALQSTYALGLKDAADILLITDGEVWEVDILVEQAIASGQRIFAVGIGSAPAASLLHTLACKSGGACEFIGINDDIYSAILRMFKRIRQAPVTELTLRWDMPATWQCDPERAVFSGETTHVFAGFSAGLPTTAAMEWRQSDHADISHLALSLAPNKVAGDTLARVAAAMRLPRLAKAEQQAMAMHYQLLTDSTNLFVVLERSAADKPLRLPALRMVPQMAAAGWGGAGSVACRPDANPTPGIAVFRRAFASEIIAAKSSGMEAYEIPVFLRKQTMPTASADHRMALDATSAAHAPPLITHAYRYRDDLIDFLRCIDSGQNRALNAGGLFPCTFAQLAGQVPSALMQALLLIREDGYHEEDILHCLLASMATYKIELHIPQRLCLQLLAFKGQSVAYPALVPRLGAVLETLITARDQVREAPVSPPTSSKRSLRARLRGIWSRPQNQEDAITRMLRKQAD